MAQPPDLALITEHNGLFCRTISLHEPQQWLLRERRLTLLPLYCKQGEKALLRGLGAAYKVGCRLAALPPQRHSAKPATPLHLADGRLLALSFLTRRLDVDCPGWRKDTLCISADDNFSCLAARWLASYCAKLHICGNDATRRQALSRLLYQEIGLVTVNATLPPPDALFISAPSHGAEHMGSSFFTWQNWSKEATNGQGDLLSCHLAEGLLLAAGGLPVGIKPLPLLRLLHHRGIYYQILPI